MASQSLVVISVRPWLVGRIFADSIRASMGVEPVEQGANPGGGQRNTIIGCTVIEAQGIPVRIHHMAAGKYHIAYIANAFIIFFSGKHPFVAPDQAGLR